MSDTLHGPSPEQLLYAPARRSWRQWAWRWGRRLLILSVIAGIIYFCVRRPDAVDVWNNWRLARLERQCRSFSLPADTIVFEPRPQRAAALLNTDEYLPVTLPTFPTSLNEDRPSSPASETAAAYVPACWRELSRSAQYPWWLGKPPTVRAILLCHELVTRGGQHRLVVVDWGIPQPGEHSNTDNDNAANATPRFRLNFWIHKPGSWGHPVSCVRSMSPRRQDSPDWDGAGSPPLPIRFTAAELDPRKPWRFTLRYVLPKVRRWTNFELVDDPRTGKDDTTDLQNVDD
jgi:hypothetical protein